MYYIYMRVYVIVYVYIGDGDLWETPIAKFDYGMVSGSYLHGSICLEVLYTRGCALSPWMFKGSSWQSQNEEIPVGFGHLGIKGQSASRVPFQSPESVWEPFRLVMIQVHLTWKNCALRFRFSIFMSVCPIWFHYGILWLRQRNSETVRREKKNSEKQQ